MGQGLRSEFDVDIFSKFFGCFMLGFLLWKELFGAPLRQKKSLENFCSISKNQILKAASNASVLSLR